MFGEPGSKERADKTKAATKIAATYKGNKDRKKVAAIKAKGKTVPKKWTMIIWNLVFL